MARISREQFLAAAINLIGTPYIYGGRGAVENEPGVDCSGLVALAFWNAGDKETARYFAGLSARGLYAETDEVHGLSRVTDLAFYGPPEKASHVVICLSERGPVISASGGSPFIDTVKEAQEAGAKVRAWATPKYRGDFLGFRSLARFYI